MSIFRRLLSYSLLFYICKAFHAVAIKSRRIQGDQNMLMGAIMHTNVKSFLLFAGHFHITA